MDFILKRVKYVSFYKKYKKLIVVFFRTCYDFLEVNILKKILCAFIMILGLFFLTGCNDYKLNHINYKTLTSMLEKEDTFILYVGSTSCINCTKFIPKLKEVILENKLDTVMYVDLDKFSTKDKEKFLNDFSISGTPTVVFITKGKETSTANRIDGNVTKKKIIERFESNGYIKEENK